MPVLSGVGAPVVGIVFGRPGLIKIVGVVVGVCVRVAVAVGGVVIVEVGVGVTVAVLVVVVVGVNVGVNVLVVVAVHVGVSVDGMRGALGWHCVVSAEQMPQDTSVRKIIIILIL